MRWLWLGLLAGCGGGDGYAPCEAPEDCEVPEGAEAECLDKSGEGFCSWVCAVDDDCTDDPDPDYDFVCASFEAEPGLHCFPSCAQAEDEEGTCPPGYGCRSTGGGADNRKVCFPEE